MMAVMLVVLAITSSTYCLPQCVHARLSTARCDPSVRPLADWLGASAVGATNPGAGDVEAAEGSGAVAGGSAEGSGAAAWLDVAQYLDEGGLTVPRDVGLLPAEALRNLVTRSRKV